MEMFPVQLSVNYLIKSPPQYTKGMQNAMKMQMKMKISRKRSSMISRVEFFSVQSIITVPVFEFEQ
jgi:hypothetical protein